MPDLQYLVCYVSMVYVALFKAAQGSGQVEVRLIRYVNDAGTGDNGNHCDGMFGIKRSDCDHLFDICLDWESNDSPAMDSCDVGFVTTGFVHNADVIDFTESIGEAPDTVTPNPIIFSFSAWNSLGLRVKVDVTDDDSSNDNDHVELLPPATFQIQPGRNAGAAAQYQYGLAGRTSLTIWVKAYCDQNWYGSDCSVHCVPRDDVTGHYACSSEGIQRCLSGWKGRKCDEAESFTQAPVGPRVTQREDDTEPKGNGAPSGAYAGLCLLVVTSVLTVVLR